jgi:iron(III) transport system permease protein
MAHSTRLPTRWHLLVTAAAMAVVLPLAVLAMTALNPEPAVWRHISQHLLARLMVNTAVLVVGVLGLTVALGVSLAWLTSVCEFTGRRFFSWALLLPMAVPTYVLAFVYLGLLDFSGPLQRLVNLVAGRTVLLPDVRHAGGIIGVLTLALYPYVYLMARNAFMTQGRRAMEAAQALGVGPRQAFWRVALPMARPWIVGGALLVFMETLADFGAVSVFGYDTFTTAIYKAWYGFFSLSAAAQLSGVLLLLVVAVVSVESHFQYRQRFEAVGRNATAMVRYELRGWQRRTASLFAGGVLLLAFGLPFVQLALWSLAVFGLEFNLSYGVLLMNSLLLSVLAAVSVTGVALLVAYGGRNRPDRFNRTMTRLAMLGYALPGTVLAAALTMTIARLDNAWMSVLAFLGVEGGSPLIGGTLLTMMAAYLVRFLATGFNPLQGAMHRITPSIDEAARTLGTAGMALIRRVHVPILRGGLFSALIMVFVDVMKEMPITLMTRPFGWDTLAVKIFELTAEGEWQRAALPAVALILGGFYPVVALIRRDQG